MFNQINVLVVVLMIINIYKIVIVKLDVQILMPILLELIYVMIQVACIRLKIIIGNVYQAVNLHMFIRLQDHLEIIVFKIVQPKQFINMLKELYAYKIVKNNMQTQNLVISVINNVNIEQMIMELNSV